MIKISLLEKIKISTVDSERIEPLTLNEVKTHLKLNMIEDENFESTKTLSSNNYSIGTYEGDGIDVLNKTSQIVINCGLFEGIVVFKIQESDDNLNFYDWYTFDSIDSSNDQQEYYKEYSGTRQYIRVYATVTSDSCYFSASVSNLIFDVEDSVLNNFIQTAREFGEDYTLQLFTEVTIEKYLDEFPKNDIIELDLTPLKSVTEFKYKDDNGDETTLTENNDFAVDLIQGIIYTPPHVYFPSVNLWTLNAITIKCVCGYDRNTIPKSFKTAMLLHVGLMYRLRDENVNDSELNIVYKYYNMRRKDWF